MTADASKALAGRVLVLLDDGRSTDSAAVARALAEAGAAVVTVHGEGRAPDGRAEFVADPSNPIDVDTAVTMATELFGPVDGVVSLGELSVHAPSAIEELARRFPR
jgi:NAD(P)-dependent dehydrogenase (short-subunit alcohol dehydrogenase family)